MGKPKLSEPKAVCVLGMHRSGTSAVTGVLNLLGVYLGEDLYSPHAGVNEKGYWEHSDIVDLHDVILLALGSSWDDIIPLAGQWWNDPIVKPFRAKLLYYVNRDFSKMPVWGLKDPRLSRLLPLWFSIFREVAVEPVFIITVRNPMEVAKSLEKRDRFTLEKSIFLWVMHTLSAELDTRNYKRIFVTYDQLLVDPEETLTRIENTLHFSWPNPIKQVIASINEFLSPQLRHHSELEIPQETRLEKLTYDAYNSCCLAARGETIDSKESFDVLQREFADYIASFDPLLYSHLLSVSRQRAYLQREINTIYRSLSWKLMKPVRLIQNLVKKVG